MDFEVIPAIDLKEGEVVQLVGGNENRSESFGDPIKIAKRWIEEGAEFLHVIDLDGAIKGKMKNLFFIEKIIENTESTIQVGGGIRSKEIALRLSEIGADRIILGTAAFEDPSLVDDIKEEVGIEVLVSIDCKNGQIMLKGWKKESDFGLGEGIHKFEEHAIDGFLLTDIKKEGRLEGINLDVFEFAVDKTNLPIFASGGISSISDLEELKKAGVSGAVIGSALYKKSFKLMEAINSLRDI